MIRSKLIFGSILSAMMVSGCATVDGAAEPIFSAKQGDAMIAKYKPDDVFERMPEETAAATTFRNRVVAAYFVAIDARYSEFKRGISRTGKTGHLAFDTLNLGLSGLGAMFGGAAQKLAAGSTAVSGLRGSFDRELFAEKTLPVLISLMDSKRLKVRSDILRGLSQDEGVYTMQDAFADLARYEAAGSIDVAIAEAAGVAAEQAKEADYDFSKAVELCNVDKATGEKRRKVMRALEILANSATADTAALTANRALLQKAVAAAGATPPEAIVDKKAADEAVTQVRDKLDLMCDSSEVDKLITDLNAAGVKVS